MKLILQSDDYGITRAASQGILHAVRGGILRNTGLFTNMPWTEECVEWIRPYLDQIAFGIDLNASTGSSLLGYEKVPNLCHEDGRFYTSGENRAKDTEENGFDHVDYDQVYAEFEAQIERFIELVGKKPDYIHGHAYGTKTTEKARKDLAEKYGVIYTGDVRRRPDVGTPKTWYTMGSSPEAQLKNTPLEIITADEAGMLGYDYGYVITHCGYCDAELFELSSFNTCRAVDLAAVCDPRFKAWIEENNIEITDLRNL